MLTFDFCQREYIHHWSHVTAGANQVSSKASIGSGPELLLRDRNKNIQPSSVHD